MVLNEVWHYRHDMTNLCFLPFVIIPNILYLSNPLSSFFSSLQYISFFAYVAFDTLFVALIPSCVASPSTIIYHHLLVALGWLAIILDNTFYYHISFGILVEINTFFHIARRNFRQNAFLQIMFFVSWFICRNVLYPIVLYKFTYVYLDYSTLPGNSYWNSGLIMWILMVALNALNTKWTYDLVKKKLRIENNRIVFDEKHDKGM